MSLNVLRSAALATAMAFMAFPATADISFVLHNTTERVIMYFYASPSSADDWGDDILGDDVIEAGESGTVTLVGDDCAWDIMAVFEDEEEFQDSINACETAEYTIIEE